MTSIKGIYENGRVTLAEPILITGPLEVVVVYDEPNVTLAGKATLSFPTYDASLADSAELFGRELL